MNKNETTLLSAMGWLALGGVALPFGILWMTGAFRKQR